MSRRKKLATPPGVSEWERLETHGDARRLIRWCILALKDGRLERADAIAFGQLAQVLLRAIEGDGVERRLTEIERRLAEAEPLAGSSLYEPRNQTQPH